MSVHYDENGNRLTVDELMAIMNESYERSKAEMEAKAANPEPPDPRMGPKLIDPRTEENPRHIGPKFYDARAEASRKNGAKSRGPLTALGREISCNNALKHGLAAKKSIVLDPADEEEYAQYKQTIIDTLNPEDQLQMDYLMIYIQNVWRCRQVTEIEADFMDDNLDFRPRLNNAMTSTSFQDRFLTLARYQSLIERSRDKALTTFFELKNHPYREHRNPKVVFKKGQNQNVGEGSALPSPENQTNPSQQTPDHPSGSVTVGCVVVRQVKPGLSS